jgi:fatty acid desaturase
VFPNDYAELKRRVTAAGLLDKRPGYYVATMSANLVLVGLLVAALVIFRSNLPILLAVAAGMGFMGAQLGFVGHDAGHRQMFAAPWKNVAAGLFWGNLVMGMSPSWWNDKHNAHHGNPNHTDMDPDIDTPIVAYSAEQARGKARWARWIVRRQAYLLFPLLSLLAWNMHLSSVEFLLRRRSKRTRPEVVANRTKYRRIEIALLLVHLPFYLGGLVLLLGWYAIPVILIHHAVWGIYIGCSFAPNHKGMPMLDDSSQLDFFRKQVLTARNVRPSVVRDYLYGGLNYQIEHHLFPACPHPHLPALRRLVRQFCSDVGVPYHEVGVVDSYRELLGFLNAVGRSLDEPPAGVFAAA